MYELTVERDFSAAHLMRDYPGACARLHGHNYRVLLSVQGDALDERGMLLDFAELKSAFDGILDGLDHRNLNEIPPFDEINPSSENLARYIYERASDALGGEDVRVASVTIYESATSSVTYREG
ncbi:MAG: 6-carboxytetrahydropterin synthase QueD [Armatimonadia bacterium]|nr:6-carboxytetrahydropterin synthase QueD [Armatimonadia bacterium]